MWGGEGTEVCPTPLEFAGMWQCMDGATEAHQIERCVGRWGADRVWNCMLSDPAIGKLTVDDLRRFRQPAAELCPGPQEMKTILECWERSDVAHMLSGDR